ncbi:MAG: hypothetical protein IPK26_07075 [Planctomycetes bacterium]|nr:hypothetical protein [Planctomycetota bacterium]
MRSIRLSCAALLSGAFLPAQVTNLPGTGCFTQGYPTANGQPRIGQTFGTDYDPGRAQAFSAVGTVAPVPLPLPPAIACQSGCLIGINAIAVVAGPSWAVTIPANPALVGTCLGAQVALFGLIGPPCVELTGAVQFCIQP